MNHYVYQITNNINSKIYIGKRSCKCSIENDTYFGSGYHLRRAIKKYGKENFTKTIIDICETADQAYELEAVIVDDEFLKRTDTYNLCGGGIGGGVGECAAMFGKNHSEETKAKISTSNKGKPVIHSDETKRKISKSLTGRHPSDETRQKMSTNSGIKGKTHSCEARIRISESRIGDKNPMYGKPGTRLGKKCTPEQIAKRVATRAANKLKKDN